MDEIKVPGEHPHSYLLLKISPRRVGHFHHGTSKKLVARNLEACVRVMTGPANMPVDVFSPADLRRMGNELLAAAWRLEQLQKEQL